MKRIGIVYHSKYGSTRKYAQWTAQMLGADLFESKKCRIDDLIPYEVIIYAGNIYASSLAGSALIKKNLERLDGKDMVFLAVGASPEDPEAVKTLMEHNFAGTRLVDAPVFYVRGAFDMSKMTFFDRILCGMLKKSVAKKNPATLEPWEKGLLECLDSSSDWTAPENVTSLVEYVRSIT
ncbi:MAG: flavodoxin domain-containing protein [Sphaerochaetaceae bacterium]|nr:flavodoxin domain-containing protein [Sphaerochaetaceae bacterium]